jgi:hypothetical protein
MAMRTKSAPHWGFLGGGELHSDNRDVKVEAETDGGEGERECA